MKKLLSLLSILTISGTTMPNAIAVSSYQKLEKLNRLKRDLLDTALINLLNGIIDLEGLGNLKLSQQEIDELNRVYDPATADYTPGFTEPVVNSITTNDGATFTFKWRWYKLFYWTLSMNDKACKKILESSALDFVTAIEGILGGAGSLFAAGLGVAANSTLPVTTAGIGIASAATYLNSLAIKEIIKSNNKGNGVWIGFWLNQPGVWWGSL